MVVVDALQHGGNTSTVSANNLLLCSPPPPHTQYTYPAAAVRMERRLKSSGHCFVTVFIPCSEPEYYGPLVCQAPCVLGYPGRSLLHGALGTLDLPSEVLEPDVLFTPPPPVDTIGQIVHPCWYFLFWWPTLPRRNARNIRCSLVTRGSLTPMLRK